MTTYKVYSAGECMSNNYTIEAKSDIGAKRMARGYHNPYQSNWQWYGSTIVINLETGKGWILEAGNESKGWQVYKG